MDILAERLECNCNPGFVYKSKSTFRTHYKSQRHIAFEFKQQELNHRKTIIELNNQIVKLKLEKLDLSDKYFILKDQYDVLIQDNEHMNQTIQYWKEQALGKNLSRKEKLK